MSRIGKRPIQIEEGINVSVQGAKVVVTSPKGELAFGLPTGISIKIENNFIYLTRADDSKNLRAQHGLSARLIRNMIVDLKDGFKKVLEFKGTGYRVRIEGSNIILTMGYSHEITLTIPEELNVTTAKNTITVAGIKRDMVGQFAAIIREVRGPEPYKGKGIKYSDEVIKRKAGKAAQSGGKG